MEFKPKIEKALRPLLGLDLVSVSRSVESEWFTFGHHHKAEAIEVELAPFALQVTCPWRLLAGGRILAGSADHRRPDEEDPFEEDFDWPLTEPEWLTSSSEWRVTSLNWIDVREQQLRAQLERTCHSVAAIEVDDSGWFRLVLSFGLVLEVFPNASTTDHDDVEFWRFFQPGLDYSHFVMTSSRAERV